MEILTHDYELREYWENTWPLSYPEWFINFWIWKKCPTYWREHLLYDRAQERANRRLRKKAMKAARAQGLGKRSRMPGAWPV